MTATANRISTTASVSIAVKKGPYGGTLLITPETNGTTWINTIYRIHLKDWTSFLDDKQLYYSFSYRDSKANSPIPLSDEQIPDDKILRKLPPGSITVTGKIWDSSFAYTTVTKIIQVKDTSTEQLSDVNELIKTISSGGDEDGGTDSLAANIAGVVTSLSAVNTTEGKFYEINNEDDVIIY